MSLVNLVPLIIGFVFLAMTCTFVPWRVTQNQQAIRSADGKYYLRENRDFTWAPLWAPPDSRSVISCYPDPIILLAGVGLSIGIPLLIRRTLKRGLAQSLPDDESA